MQTEELYCGMYTAYSNMQRYIKNGWKVVSCVAGDNRVIVVYEKEGE